MRTDFEILEARLDYSFRDRSLLERALTHRSHAHELGHERHLERLEFLGDAVVGCLVAEWLYALPGELPEGELARRKSRLVSSSELALEAIRLDLGSFLRLGVGEERSGGRNRTSVLADAYEAVLGAAFLDGGWDAARRILRHYLERLRECGSIEEDAKTALQELAQSRGWEIPAYELLEASGPDHDKTFRVAVAVGPHRFGPETGKSKKEAQQQVAARALLALRSEADRGLISGQRGSEEPGSSPKGRGEER